MTHDILIVGSGLAGSSMACALAQRGWDVLLLERQQQAQHKVCGEFLSPEAQDSLRALGLFERVAALGPVAIGRASLTSMRGRLLSMPLPGSAWGVSRYALDAALLDQAEKLGVHVRRGATVTALTMSPNGSSASLRMAHGSSTAQARFAVIACGRHVPVGLRAAPVNQAATTRRAAAQSYVGVKCHYTGITMPACCELFLIQDGYLGVSPIESGAVNVCMLLSKQAFSQAGGSVAGALAMASHSNLALARRLEAGTVVAESCVAVAGVNTQRSAQAWGLTAQIGDAVAMIPPLCGDGMAMALRSAQLAAPLADAVLAGELEFAAWPAAHKQRWNKEFSRRIKAGRLLQSLLIQPQLADHMLRLGSIFPALAQAMLHLTRGQANTGAPYPARF